MRYIIVTGPKKTGKSYSLLKTVEKLKGSAITLGGVITRRVPENSEGDIREIVRPGGASNLRFAAVPFCSQTEWDNGIEGDVFKNCHFYFSKSAFAKGNEWIRADLECDVFFIDEIGGLEMAEDNEYKWDFTLPLAQARENKRTLLFSVKEKLVDEFIEKYNYNWVILKTQAGRDISDRILSEILSGEREAGNKD
jgi:nucleoside-triphosphatase THEP1